MIDKKYPQIKGGFIHVPFAPEQVVGHADNTPSMPIEIVAKALEYAIESIVTNNEDNYKEEMGTII
jgi:pyroglutamyl-peptidase